MPPLTDLTWTQVNSALKIMLNTNSDLITLDSYGIPSTINVAAIVEIFPADSSDTTSQGVLKFMARLFDACREAQIAANVSQPIGEKLNAFGPPASQVPVGTLIPIVRTLTVRADLASANRIIGTNA